MPTPMAIIVATDVAHSGTSTTLASRAISPDATPIPNTAVTMGRPIASNDPKLTSRITPAARKPTPSAPTAPCSAFCTAWPASSIWTRSSLASAAVSSSRWVTSTGMSQVSSCTVA